MSKAKEYDLVGELRDSFPELEDAYQERVRISGEEPPNSYEIVGALLRPRFKRELATGLVTDFVRRSAVFFEKVCASGDVEALNVIWVKSSSGSSANQKNSKLFGLCSVNKRELRSRIRPNDGDVPRICHRYCKSKLLTRKLKNRRGGSPETNNSDNGYSLRSTRVCFPFARPGYTEAG